MKSAQHSVRLTVGSSSVFLVFSWHYRIRNMDNDFLLHLLAQF